MCGRVALEAPCKAAWLAAMSASELPLSVSETPQNILLVHRIHNLRGIFTAADAIAAVKFGDAPSY